MAAKVVKVLKDNVSCNARSLEVRVFFSGSPLITHAPRTAVLPSEPYLTSGAENERDESQPSSRQSSTSFREPPGNKLEVTGNTDHLGYSREHRGQRRQTVLSHLGGMCRRGDKHLTSGHARRRRHGKPHQHPALKCSNIG